jgi:hypothetical protein
MAQRGQEMLMQLLSDGEDRPWLPPRPLATPFKFGFVFLIVGIMVPMRGGGTNCISFLQWGLIALGPLHDGH